LTARAATDITARSAIEALRAGVPNRAAIRLLEPDESTLRRNFLELLRLCDPALRDDGLKGFSLPERSGPASRISSAIFRYWRSKRISS
jgi:hypothetical protein